MLKGFTSQVLCVSVRCTKLDFYLVVSAVDRQGKQQKGYRFKATLVCTVSSRLIRGHNEILSQGIQHNNKVQIELLNKPKKFSTELVWKTYLYIVLKNSVQAIHATNAYNPNTQESRVKRTKV